MSAVVLGGPHSAPSSARHERIGISMNCKCSWIPAWRISSEVNSFSDSNSNRDEIPLVKILLFEVLLYVVCVLYILVVNFRNCDFIDSSVMRILHHSVSISSLILSAGRFLFECDNPLSSAAFLLFGWFGKLYTRSTCVSPLFFCLSLPIPGRVLLVESSSVLVPTYRCCIFTFCTIIFRRWRYSRRK